MLSRSSRGIGMLYHGYLLHTVQSMYRNIVEPHSRFCCTMWGVCSAAALNKIQKLQSDVASIATNSPCHTPSQSLLGTLGWKTIGQLIDMETLTIVYRSINNEASNYLLNLFKSFSQNAIRELQNAETDLKLPLPKTSSGQKYLSCRGEFNCGTT